MLHHRQLGGTSDAGPIDATGEALDGIYTAANDVLNTRAAFRLGVLFEGYEFGDDWANQIGRVLG